MFRVLPEGNFPGLSKNEIYKLSTNCVGPTKFNFLFLPPTLSKISKESYDQTSFPTKHAKQSRGTTNIGYGTTNADAGWESV